MATLRTTRASTCENWSWTQCIKKSSVCTCGAIKSPSRKLGPEISLKDRNCSDASKKAPSNVYQVLLMR
ncbi:hypothetical protein CUC08_Gglean012100 [Alternaria sp. MG1]|nr:hypothetical protein CUC08_Gglean012100 [Alternaria sp. MG1]